MKHFKHLLYLVPIISVFLTSCTTNINLNLPSGEEKLVVEGHIEPGQPPFILLTKSTAYFASTSINDIANSFVHNAVIKISDGTVTDSLIEINLASIPDSLAKMIMDLYQINIGSIALGVDFSFYTSLTLIGEVGKTYTLSIAAQGKKLSAITTIPQLVIPDSFYLMPPENDPKDDTLMRLFISFKDPANEANYYRYFTKRNKGPFNPGRGNSVFDDRLFNGQPIKWNLERASNPNDTLDKRTHGMFWKGDTVVVKYCTLDAAHFDFWQTFEQAMNSGGPYANPVQIKSNIIGGLGVWGGYGSIYRTIYIPK